MNLPEASRDRSCGEFLYERNLGWHRDIPDTRDFSTHSEAIAIPLRSLDPPRDSGPKSDDELLQYFPPAQGQTGLATSSVQACISLLQYFERRATGEMLRPSRLFTYKVARQVHRWRGDTGLPLRTTLKSIVRFGLPPEHLWPYEPSAVDRELEAALFSYPYPDLLYFRLDTRGVSSDQLLKRLKTAIDGGFPCLFGIPVYDSVTSEAFIPMPTVYDKLMGGQALVAVGYDDDSCWGSSVHGHLKVRNSWGTQWGDDGYGYLPYEYVIDGLACDFWTLLRPIWIESGEFSHPFLSDESSPKTR